MSPRKRPATCSARMRSVSSLARRSSESIVMPYFCSNDLRMFVKYVAPLAELLDVAAPFAITEDRVGRTGRDAFGRRIVRRFNSSVMVWDGGTQTDLFTNWTPAAAHELSGDQDWIGQQRPSAVTWPRAWFPRLSEVRPPWPTEAKVVLCKVPKNHVAAERWPWFAPLWGAA